VSLKKLNTGGTFAHHDHYKLDETTVRQKAVTFNTKIGTTMHKT